MRKAKGILFFAALPLLAFNDADLDGVEDSVDRCPATPITDIVDERGCSIRSVIVETHYDLIVGAALSQYNYRLNADTDTFSTTLQVDYYRGDFTAQLLTSWYRSEGDGYDRSGMDDTTVALYYTFRNLYPRLDLQLGAGVVLPTYDAEYGNNEADYLVALNLGYDAGAFTLFAGYTFTAVGDGDVEFSDGTQSIRYEDTHAFHLGAGRHFGTKLYASLSYYRSDSIYRGVDAIENLSVYGFYSLDAHWFLTGSYAYGLSDTTSDNYFALRVGYYF